MLDLQGFLTIPDFLSPAEVQRLNAAFDANWEQRVPSVSGVRGGVGGSTNEFRGMCEWPQPHCEPFRELLCHPRLQPVLDTVLGTSPPDRPPDRPIARSTDSIIARASRTSHDDSPVASRPQSAAPARIDHL